MDEGKEFVIAHSHGGIPGCGATKGLAVHDSAAASKKGRFPRDIVHRGLHDSRVLERFIFRPPDGKTRFLQ